MDTLEKIIPDFLYKHYISTLTQIVAETLNKQPFWWVLLDDSSQKTMIYDSNTGLLWDATPDIGATFNVAEGKTKAAASKVGRLSNWRLPTKRELTAFANDAANPLRKGVKSRLLDKDNWVTSNGNVDLDSCELVGHRSGALLACNDWLVGKGKMEVVGTALQRGWQLRECTPQEKLLALNMLQDVPDLQAAYFDIDYVSARLPKLDSMQFTDPNKGLWEFWGKDEELLTKQGVRARNPALDVQDCNVAIDFGTSSTVVAYDDNDQHKLLRSVWATIGSRSARSTTRTRRCWSSSISPDCSKPGRARPFALACPGTMYAAPTRHCRRFATTTATHASSPAPWPKSNIGPCAKAPPLAYA